MNIPCGVTNATFIDLNQQSSSNNVRESNFTYSSVDNNDNNKTPDTPIKQRNVQSSDIPKIFFNFTTTFFNHEGNMPAEENWYQETTNIPGGYATKIIYTSTTNNSNNMFNFDTIFDFSNVFEFSNNSSTKSNFHQLNPSYNFEKLKYAFDLLSINKEDFDKLTKEQQEKKLKDKYYQAAKKYHPDKNKNDKDATVKFQELNEHKEILLNYVRHGITS